MTKEEVLDGGGDAGALMRASAWAATPLGVAQWSPALRMMVGLLLSGDGAFLGDQSILLGGEQGPPEERWLAEGFDRHLVKPVALADLGDALAAMARTEGSSGRPDPRRVAEHG